MSDTTITISKINQFIKEAKAGDRLPCQKIKGFCIKKTESGYSYRLRYYPAGKDRVITIGDQSIKPAQAASIAIKLRADIKTGVDPLVQKQKQMKLEAEEQHRLKYEGANTVGAFFQDHYIAAKAIAANEGKESLARISRNFVPCRDAHSNKLKKPVHDISGFQMEDAALRTELRTWEKKRKKNGAKRDTIVADLTALKAMFSYAVGARSDMRIDEPVIQTNPLEKFKATALTAKERDELLAQQSNNRRMLTVEEQYQLIQGLELYAEKKRSERRNSITHGKPHLPSFDGVMYPHWFIPFCLTAFHTGLRPSDIYGLKWEPNAGNHVNLNFRQLLVRPEKTRHKGGKPIEIRFPMQQKLQGILSDWHRQCGAPVAGFVFPNKSGERIAKKSHETHWDHVKRLGGLKDLTFYSLRHHFVSALVDAGVPLLQIAELTGHKSTAMIESHYGHLLPNKAEKIIADFDLSTPNFSSKVTRNDQQFG